MNTLFDVLVNDILSVFINHELLNVGIAGSAFTYLDIFKVLFVAVISYFVVWLFVLLPWKVCKKIMQYDKLKGGKH